MIKEGGHLSDRVLVDYKGEYSSSELIFIIWKVNFARNLEWLNLFNK